LEGDGVTLLGAVFVVEGVPVLDGVCDDVPVRDGVTLGVGLLDAYSAPTAALTPQIPGFVYVRFTEHPVASLYIVSVTFFVNPHVNFTNAERFTLTKGAAQGSPLAKR